MEKSLKVLMVSSDRNVLVPGSAVARRMIEYGSLVEELHIILMSDKSHMLSDRKIGENVWVYPTNSSFSVLRPVDAAGIGKRVVLKNRFVRGLSLVTADSLEAGWAAMKIKKRWRLPMELQMHTDPFSAHFSGFQNLVRRFFMKRIINNADSIRVVSPILKSKIMNLKPDASVVVLPVYVDREKIENSQIKFDVHTRYPWHFIALMVCRLEPEKNIPLAFNVMKLVRERYQDAGLLIVGSGTQEKMLKDKVKKLGLTGGVEFAGWQEDLASFYRTANVFLQTSLFEGYGLSLVEAGLSGLPVITTPVGLAQELEAGRDVYMYPASKPELFAAGIIDLIENNQKRENLKINLKRALDAKLMTKGEYLEQMKNNWVATSKKIQ